MRKDASVSHRKLSAPFPSVHSCGGLIHRLARAFWSVAGILRLAPGSVLFLWAVMGGFVVALSGCVTPGGEVVKVTEVKEDVKLAGLSPEHRELLEEIKKSKETRSPLDRDLSHVLQKTPQYSVSEFFTQYPEVRAATTKDYKVGGFDVLSITVYEEPDLSREALRVSGEGYISFPLIGRLRVAGLTTSEIEKLISDRLAEGQYLLNAHISVMVTEFSSKRFLVLGAVKSPGSYSLRAKERVLDGISKAGGVDLAQAGNRAMVIRDLSPDPEREQKVVININLRDLLSRGDQLSNLYLLDRDVLYVPTAEYFYIIGQVNTPGSYTMPEEELTLVGAIGMAGGFTRIAARNRTRIIRVEQGKEKIIEVKVDAITKAGKKIQDVPIRPGDVIVVPESFF